MTADADFKSDTPALSPRAARKPEATHHHGRERIDAYAWLRAANWQDVMRDPSVLDAEIRAHLEAENAHTEAVLAGTERLQEKLFAEMKGRIREDNSSVPAPDGPFAYATRFVTGGQQPLLVRTPRGGGEETVLLDGDALAEGKAFFRLAGAEHSPDHRLMYWASDEAGSEFYTIRVRDLATGSDLPDTIPETTGGAVWSADGAHLFYTWLDGNHRPRRVMRHRIGTDPKDDAVVYEETDPGFFVGVGKTQSGRFVVIHANDHETSEARIVEAANPTAEPRLVAARKAGVEYRVEHHGDELVILTNADGAEDFKIVTASVDAPAPGNWVDRVPHVTGRLILDAVAYAGHLVRLEREDGLPRIVIHRFADDEEHAIRFDEEAYSLGVTHGYEYETTTIRFSYSSPTTPAQVFDYDMETRARTLRKEQEVPSGHDPADYVTRRLHAPTVDGETVPVTVIHRRDAPLDGSAPALLYGYGSYGIAIPAAVQHQHPVAGRSRVRLRHRAYPRRQGQGLPLVPRRQGGEEAQHVQRLHRGGRASDPGGVYLSWPHRGAGRLGRRHAHGSGGQHGARPLPRHRRGGAVRRRAGDDARRDAAADAAGMARMGKPAGERRRL